MTLNEAINTYRYVLTEGSVIERIKREFDYPLDPFLLNSLMIYNEKGKILLGKIYKQYIDLADENKTPIMILTPTWRANPERSKLAQVDIRSVNEDAFIFMNEIRKTYGYFSDKIFIGGLIGCKGDSYKPEEALSSAEAFDFHSPQVNILADAGVDFLYASTLPALSEALGIAQAMSNTKKEYLISFVIRENGKLLDGNLLTDAIKTIDNYVDNPPTFYLTNCIHPEILNNALINLADDDILSKRLFGIQANASKKSPEELDGASHLDADSPTNWAQGMIDLNKKYNLKILGGCCGTDASFISSVVDLLKSTL